MKTNYFPILSNSIFLNPQKVSYFSKNKVGSKKLRANDVYINWMDCTMLKKIVPMSGSKIHLFGSFFLLWRCFWLLNHDFSPITIIILAIHYIANYNFSATAHAGSSKIAENLPHFLRSVSILAVYPVYIFIVVTSK